VDLENQKNEDICLALTPEPFRLTIASAGLISFDVFRRLRSLVQNGYLREQ
jgi:hypothetical protein